MGALDDLLLAPPRNPTAPPDALADLIRGLGQRGAQWAKTPGTIMQGVQPETPGQWSEEDQFRQNHLQDTPYQWAPEASLLMTGLPRSSGASTLTSGAGSKMAQPEIIGGHVSALKAAEAQAIREGESTPFLAVLDQIKADPGLRVADIQAIAKEFSGAPLKPTKQGALDKINEGFLDRAYQATKMRQVDKAKL